MDRIGIPLHQRIGIWAARTRPAVLAVVVASLVSYAGSPWNGFVLDDHPVILQNPVVLGDAPLSVVFTSPYYGDDRSDLLYRPLTTLSLRAQVALHGAIPAPFHVVNVLLHALASVLVLLLGRALIPGRSFAVLIGALLFAVHPIHTDAVSSIVNRSEILALVFAILAFLSFRRWQMRDWGVAGLALAAICALASFLSKESGGPIVAFALLWILLVRGQGRSLGMSMVGWAVAFALPVLVYGLMRWEALGGTLTTDGNRYFTAVERIETLYTMLGVGARYLKLLVVPHPLSPDYSFQSIPTARTLFEAWPLAGALLVPSVLLGTAWLATRRADTPRAAGLAMAWFVLFMVPASHLVPILVPMAERLTYVPSAGFCLAAGVLADVLASRFRVAVPALLAGVLVAGAALTFARDGVWRDDLTLSADAVVTHPRNALMVANLGSQMARRGNLAAAVAAFERALEVSPGKWEFRVVLADVLEASGRHADEAKILLDGVRRGPPPRSFHGRICTALVRVNPDLTESVCLQKLGSP